MNDWDSMNDYVEVDWVLVYDSCSWGRGKLFVENKSDCTSFWMGFVGVVLAQRLVN